MSRGNEARYMEGGSKKTAGIRCLFCSAFAFILPFLQHGKASV